MITGGDSLLMDWDRTVTIKIAMLLGDQIRFFWTAIGCNHLVMSACLLFWILTYLLSARCIQNNCTVNMKIIWGADI